ncbi:arsenite S-adenosylmethyltransferase [Candidatus Gottesmanbacteria bacterium CG11_big_fil_rev_8_21_14_0_20_37_11]|uniref:Arsenite methyltransferase n=4 Tax=Microgenomates group TaxID=1794810 RepID=A0A2M7RPD1_9BACT|nr:MAG: arsenite S-adenosylmethyltransferase [Candidatus Gottesmanbacteria bacterium CG1_02_37_22]PIP32230.1 MAG: arsenite S-adenosylmethyltransferase [Candidatus Gottesmanbacteria bacterium CG23_combo_of_CG06-09_8_20_14_all_37_19]PIR08349.1 MAG: arsenite S-adenosylmethyltransferase [Candidatus Gottesmanbacteria bacterium CG11_big_fil_rev_8_21_14_0_20_37_11]PIZ02198.1 MAG: arsenite S-adenosylmethyltransferase [Candidatus Gottesmanbacteria bacterium CG_4_10_14_0_8_um_filter_37_24]
MDNNQIKNVVKNKYGEIAKKDSGCCGNCNCGSDSSAAYAKQLGYGDQDISSVPTGSNLSLGCGNPTAISSIKPGETVLDLGSGAGFDAFLASPKVGAEGKVIGVDMTDEMIQKARENAVKGNYTNIEFKKGDIEDLPVEDQSIDVIISNCVINLAPNKDKVFSEAYRVLKPGGRLMVSDVVLVKSLPEELRKNEDLLTGCVSGAMLKQDYLKLLEKAGFKGITISKEEPMFLKDYALSISYSAYK